MGQGIIDRDRFELASRATPERSSAGGEHNRRYLIVDTDLSRDLIRSQALVNGTVFAVDGHDLSTGGLPCPLHHRTGSDQRFLVGKTKALPRFECGQRDR